jgi:glycosyltransferase involved in cell wall biosynthesis
VTVPRPLVSVILPTYNRAPFLRQAFASIRSQTFASWELIVVDDGSTDETREMVEAFAAEAAQQVRYVFQANQGAYAARNKGLDEAPGDYVAFYDSDDTWLPHHLGDSVSALEANGDVDWVYGPNRMMDWATGKELEANTFHVCGQDHPFLKLHTRRVGKLRIIEDPEITRCAVRYGLCCGLQDSVVRRRVFASRRFCPRRNGEDQLIVVRVAAAGHRLGYFEDVHGIYHVHQDNSSAASLVVSREKHLRIMQTIAQGFEELRGQVRLTRSESRALDRRLQHEYFWNQGYALLWRSGQRQEALRLFRHALRLYPWDVWCWKTYLLARVRMAAGLV